MELIQAIIASIIVAATPLAFAAIGEVVAEKSGVLNLGVEGMMIVGAIAGFAVFGLHDGVQDMFAQAQWHEGVQKLMRFEEGYETRWIAMTFLSAAAIICLPRQFHVTVVENIEPRDFRLARCRDALRRIDGD